MDDNNFLKPIPWLPYMVTEYIKSLKLDSVFEWGSGSSTLLFTELGVDYLVSVEHDRQWWEKVHRQLPEHYLPGYHFIPYQEGTIGSNKANPVHYKSGSTELGEVNFREYATFIDRLARKFDLILIDGMARASCLYHAAKYVAEGGCIVLDNAERDYYMVNINWLFEGWERIEFTGYGPGLDYEWKTLVIKNTRKRDYE